MQSILVVATALAVTLVVVEAQREGRDCGDPGIPQNGGRSLNPNTLATATVTYTCNRGFNLIGSSSAVCRSDGTWSEPRPACQFVGCCDLEAPRNGAKRGDGATFTDVVSFSCDAGFRLVGPDSRTCQADGTWTGTQVRCEPLSCPVPRSVANGGYIASSFNVGGVATFYCDTGYSLISDRLATCLPSGAWDKPLPACVPVNCGNPGAPENGAIQGNNFAFHMSVTFSCDTGFRLGGSKTRFCTANGTWTGSTATCNRVLCDRPGDLANGDTTMTSVAVGGQVSWSCNPGYELTGSCSATCESSGVWSSPPPVCEPVICDDPGFPLFGTRTLEGLEFQNRVDWTCDAGHVLSGQASAVCTPGGTWSNPIPMCIPVDCGDPGTPVNGRRNLGGTTLDSRTTYACDEGYRMDGDMEAICLPSGLWSRPLPRCISIECADIRPPANGDRTIRSRVVGAEAGFTCDIGFTMQGVQSVTCLPSGQWSAQPPVCRIVDCGELPAHENGAITVSTTGFNSKARYRCEAGYNLVGSSVRDCFASGIWNPEAPTCDKISCGNPGIPANGKRTGDDFTFEARVTFMCDENFQLNGAPAAVCRVDGSWSNPLPSCDPDCLVSEYGDFGPCTVTCGEGIQIQTRAITQTPSGLGNTCPVLQKTQSCDEGPCVQCAVIEIDNGVVRQDGKGLSNSQTVLQESSVDYECDQGYTMAGSRVLNCVEALRGFDRRPPVCEPIICPDPGTPRNGAREGDSFTYLSEVVFSCDPGYELTGSRRRTCRVDRTWSGSPAACQPVDCGDPGAPDNGARALNPNSLFRSTVTYTCNTGYDLIGSASAVCQPGGVWSQPPAVCQLVSCCELEAPRSGSKLGDGTNYNDVVSFSCNQGFELVGDQSRTCQLDGSWTGEPVRCEPITCPVPRTIDNGGYTATSLNAGSTATFYCDTGYHLSSDSVLTCLQNGRWDKPLPECVVINCGNPGSPENGGREGDNFEFRMSVSFTCNPGYRLVGSMTRFCQADGTWTGSAPMCNQIVCGDPGTPVNGDRTLTSIAVDGQVTWTCNAGFRLIGSSLATCRSTGAWSAPTPFCERIECPDIVAPQNGERFYTSRVVGSDASFTCNEGYTLLGVRSVTCLETGQWSEVPPICEIITCPNPGAPVNGQRIGEVFTYGSRVSWVCDINYQLSGQPGAVCQADGTWSNPLPSCDPDCIVGSFGPFSPCSTTCGDGTQVQTRPVLQRPAGLGRPCPALEQSQSCNLRPCIQCEDQYAEGAIVYRLTQVDLSVSTCVVIVVDESNSMAGEHAWLPGMSEGLEENLLRQGIGSPGSRPNTYSLVGYGRREPDFYAHFLEDDRGRRVFNSGSFPQAARKLYADPEGRIEDGYEAIMFALSNIECESNGTSSVAKNLIFISDEDRDETPRGRNITRQVLKRFLRRNNWLPNVVIDNKFACGTQEAIGVDSELTAFMAQGAGSYRACPTATLGAGYASTKKDYTNLALELGGAAWDISVLRRGGSLAASFTNAFTDVKTSEIRRATEQCRRCTCTDVSSQGQFRCIPDNDQARCTCIAEGGSWDATLKSCQGLPEPTPCIVSQWQPWSACSATCGSGVRSRSRQVLQEPVNDGEECPSLTEAQTCSLGECARDCRHPGSPANGETNPTSASQTLFRERQRVIFFCNSGYRLVGSASATCLSSGRWSQPVPTCARLECTPGQVTHESASSGLCADIRMIIDQSRSMEGEIAWLPGFISNLETSLRSRNIGVNFGAENRYSLTGFGRATPNERGHVYTTNGNANCFSASRFGEVNQKVVADPNGRFEDGYEAIAKNLKDVKCERDAQCTVGCNVILISDEDRDELNASITTNTIRSRLREQGCILNVVVDNTFTGSGETALGIDSKGNAYMERSAGRYRVETTNVVAGVGYSSTKAQYTDLALQLGGGAWDINILRQGGNPAASFTSGMVDFKSEEILEQLTGCRQCSCSGSGQKSCVVAPNQQQCSCLAAGNTWNQFTNTCT